MKRITQKRNQQARRKHRVRAKISGTAGRPRLSVHRSLKYITAQLVNDEIGVTLLAASDRDGKITGKKSERAKQVGIAIAEAAKAKGITEIVFDRGSSRFQGRVKELADGVREGGLKF